MRGWFGRLVHKLIRGATIYVEALELENERRRLLAVLLDALVSGHEHGRGTTTGDRRLRRGIMEKEAMIDEARHELEELVRGIGQAIIRALPEGVGFALILADFGDEGSFAYTANMDRGDFLNLLREALEKLQQAPAKKGEQGEQLDDKGHDQQR